MADHPHVRILRLNLRENHMSTSRPVEVSGGNDRCMMHDASHKRHIQQIQIEAGQRFAANQTPSFDFHTVLTLDWIKGKIDFPETLN